MILSRKSALYFLLINSFYLVYYIALLIYLKERVILDIYKPPLQLSIPAWIITQTISIVLIYVGIFTGLIMVLLHTKERLFIIIAFTLFALMRLISDGVGFLAAFKLIDFSGFVLQLIWPAMLSVLIYLTISVFFIKTRAVRRFYIWFVIVTIVTMALPTITGYLADNFSLYWTLVNPNVLKIVPLFVSFSLYYKLYRSSAPLLH